MQKVAFFDIDGTVFRSSLLIELVDSLIKAGHFPVEAQEEFREAHEAWWNREGDYEAYIEAVVKTFREHLQGVHYGDMADVGRQVVAVQRRRVYRYTRDLIKDLKEDLTFASHSLTGPFETTPNRSELSHSGTGSGAVLYQPETSSTVGSCLTRAGRTVLLPGEGGVRQLCTVQIFLASGNPRRPQ